MDRRSFIRQVMLFSAGYTLAVPRFSIPDASAAALPVPDLASVTGRLSDTEIEATLVDGRPARGMPPSLLTPEQRTDVVAFLHWLGEHRAELLALIGDDKGSSGVPWFEFK